MYGFVYVCVMMYKLNENLYTETDRDLLDNLRQARHAMQSVMHGIKSQKHTKCWLKTKCIN